MEAMHPIENTVNRNSPKWFMEQGENDDEKYGLSVAHLSGIGRVHIFVGFAGPNATTAESMENTAGTSLSMEQVDDLITLLQFIRYQQESKDA
jgi:hypothetical protein